MLGGIKDRLNELKLKLAGMKERLNVEFRINLDDIIDQPRTGDVPVEEGEWPRYFVGTPAMVRGELEQMAGELGIRELVVNTIVWEHAKRVRSYELLAGKLRQL